MASVSFSKAAVEDLDRLTQFLREAHPEDADSTAGLINSAAAALQDHPLIGRLCESGFRELLISRGHSGYIAMYEYREATDEAIIHRIRHQREAGVEDP